MSLLSNFRCHFTSISVDSRTVQAGGLFLAYAGPHHDGRHYIGDAIARGAAGVLWQAEGGSWSDNWHVPQQAVPNLQYYLGDIASEFYAHPSAQLSVLGVTGTNGKTSVAHWLASCLGTINQKTALLGTLGNGFLPMLEATHNTTVGALELHKLLADYVVQGAQAAVMEVSSHGLVEGRVNGVRFDVAVFTNLSRDHLDYHGSMENYQLAKQRLLTWPHLKVAVVNADDTFGASLIPSLSADRVISYGIHAGTVRAQAVQMDARGLHFQVTSPQGSGSLSVPLWGVFNVYNLLAVLSSLLALNIDFEMALTLLPTLTPPPGRMQKISDQPMIYVDYAHTPDALQQVLSYLQTVAKHRSSKLICVFGCGGNRDRGKRPLMAKVACALADQVIITSDNPRDEDPHYIVRDMALPESSSVCVVLDRAQAIHTAIHMANEQDVVLIAGKGHEDYQEIAGIQYPFSDVAVAGDALVTKIGVTT